MIPAEARGVWRELEAHLRPYVARRVQPAEVDDVLQDTFVRVHRGLVSLSLEERFGPWVYRVARSAIVDHQRKRLRHPVASGVHTEELVESAIPDSDEELEGDLAECVALFVSRLPSPYREAVTLTELEGLTQKAAAEMLGLSLSGMKSRVQRGRERIRHMFEECCELAVDSRGNVTSCTPKALDTIPADCRDAAVDWASRRSE